MELGEEVVESVESELDIKVEHITPAIAHEYLKLNQDNRKESSIHIDWLASQMTKGKWLLTHQGLAFDEKGYLRDGQHRLRAIIISMTTQPMIVVRGLSVDTFTVMDTGKNRQAQDVLFIEGFKDYPRELSIIARGVLDWNAGQFRSIGKRGKVTNFMILQFVKKNEGLNALIGQMNSLSKQFPGILPPSLAVTYAWILKDVRNSDLLTAITFFETLYKGANMTEHSPELYLRNYLIRERMSTEKVSKVVKIALIIKGWNFFRNNQPVPKMWSWNSKEAFPIPK